MFTAGPLVTTFNMTTLKAVTLYHWDDLSVENDIHGLINRGNYHEEFLESIGFDMKASDNGRSTFYTNMPNLNPLAFWKYFNGWKLLTTVTMVYTIWLFIRFNILGANHQGKLNDFNLLDLVFGARTAMGPRRGDHTEAAPEQKPRRNWEDSEEAG